MFTLNMDGTNDCNRTSGGNKLEKKQFKSTSWDVDIRVFCFCFLLLWMSGS